MTGDTSAGGVTLEITSDRVGTVQIQRPPVNFLDAALLQELCSVLARADAEGCRAIVLRSEGRHFCAGVNFGGGAGRTAAGGELYDHAVSLFRQPLPIVAAVQGRAVGGGVGLALAADFRVASPPTRFHANFARLGLHHGFGLSVTLPAAIGEQKALDLLLTGRAVSGEEASAIGLCDRLVPADRLVAEARRLAAEIAAGAPLAARAIRSTLRRDRADQVAEACRRELREQLRLGQTEDFAEGVRAARDRREPQFHGR